MVRFPRQIFQCVRPRALRASLLTLPFFLAACETPLEPAIEIVVAESTVRIQAIRGNTTPVSHSITVSNSGGGRLGPVTCPEAPAAWLTCVVSSGNVVVLSANPSGLTSSPDPVPVLLSAPGATNSVTLIVEFVVQQPVIGLSASNVAFTATEGGATTPSSATVTVSNVGAGSIENLGGISCAPSPATTRVSCTVNQASGVLTITPNIVGLAPGSYTYVLAVTGPHASGAQSVSVNVTVGALPRIVLTPSTLHFQAVRGDATPIVRTVSVSNSGSGSLGTLSCPSNPATWLSCSVTGSNTLSFTATTAGLTESPAPVSVNVAATQAANSPLAMSVTMGLEQPVLSLGSNAVSFNVVQGTGQSTPTQHAVPILNTGAGTIANLGAVSCVPATAAPLGCAVNPSTNQIVVTVNTTGLTAGTTVYSVQVSAPNSSVQRTLAVTVVVAGPTRLVLTPNTLQFSAIRGSTATMSQTVRASNGGGGSLGTVQCPANPAAWLTCQVLSGDSLLSFTVLPSGLTASPAEVSVPVTATGDPTGTSVSVILVIEQPVLAVSQTLFQLTRTAPGTGPISVVTASNVGAGTLANLGAISCAAEAPVTCTVGGGGQLSLAVGGGGFAAGTHVRSVVVSAPNASNSVTIVLVFTINDP